MSEISQFDVESHKYCSVGDTVIAELKDGSTISGTVLKNIGATVYAMADTGGLYEFRRVRDSDTGVTSIAMGYDGKDVSPTDVKEGLNKYGHKITSESTTLSFESIVVDFETEEQEIVIDE